MYKKIKVLGIAPYDGMREMMGNLVGNFPEIELKAYTGDLEEGVSIARRIFNGNFDIVISRGQTSKLIQAEGIPVIDVEISSFDILCALKLANAIDGKSAIVSFADIASTANQIKHLLHFDTDVYSVDSISSLSSILKKIKTKNYSAVLCDMISDTIARREGINSYLITSGEKSIQRAFRQAVMLCNNHPIIQNENQLLRSLVFDSPSYVEVYNMAGECLLCTNSNPDKELTKFLVSEISETKNAKSSRKIFREIGDLMYTIKTEYLTIENNEYAVFFYGIKHKIIPSDKRGITYSSKNDAERKFNQSTFSYSEMISVINEKVTRLNKSDLPVMITGEDGTGKESLANLIYLTSRQKNNPLITIDCRLLDDKTLKSIFEDENSPLAKRKNTIYFSNIDVLNKQISSRLLSTIIQMNVCKRNRVIFSCVCNCGEHLSITGEEFAKRLNCVEMYLPPLKASGISIPNLVSQFLSHQNNTFASEIVDIEPEALSLLQEYSWPHNLSQFNRVMNQIEITAGQIITKQIVQNILENERFTATVNPRIDSSANPIDLSRTLDQINKEIVLRILKDNNNNQSATAKQLGIGRTTLWRYLQK